MAKVCPHCGMTNRDTARFCGGCSRPLVQEVICPVCGAVNMPVARFCHQCAAPLPSGGPVTGPGGTGLLPANTLLNNRYLIIQKIGQGGMGAVYKASDTRLGQKLVAVKELSEAALTDPKERQQAHRAFEQEARMLAQLSHPNLPRVTDHFSEAGKQYLVMDFIEGQTLQEMLDAARGPLDVDRVVDWAGQLCDVLDYLHNQQPPVIFRDLKPANIMLDHDGKIKLIDFGIARHFKPGKTTDTMSFGTAGYAPPEQYGKGQTDARSDVYALGATLHQLLTGRDPADNPFNFVPPRSLNPKIPKAVERAIIKAVEQDASNRWQSAREMKQALTALPSGQAVAAAPSTAMQGAYVAAPAAPPVVAVPATSAPARASVKPVHRMGYGAWLLLALLLFVVQQQIAVYLYAAGLETTPYGSSLISAVRVLWPALLFVLTQRPGSALLLFGLALAQHYLLNGDLPDSMMVTAQISGAVAMEIVFGIRRYRDFRWWMVSLAALAAGVAEWVAWPVMMGASLDALHIGTVETTRWAGALAGGLVAVGLGRLVAPLSTGWRTNTQITYLQTLIVVIVVQLFVRWWSPIISRFIQAAPDASYKSALAAAYAWIALPLVCRIARKPGTALIMGAFSVLLSALMGGTVNDILLVRIIGGALAVEMLFLLGSYRNFGPLRMILAAVVGLITVQYAPNMYRGLSLSFSATPYQLGGAALGGLLAYVIARVLKR